MIEELISRIFSTRNHAHIMHWATKSFAEHSALGSFYDTLVDLVDKFVETYQGSIGLVGEFKPKDYAGKKSIMECIQEDITWMASNRDEICQNVYALENLLDEIVGEYLSTHYKLKFLK